MEGNLAATPAACKLGGKRTEGWTRSMALIQVVAISPMWEHLWVQGKGGTPEVESRQEGKDRVELEGGVREGGQQCSPMLRFPDSSLGKLMPVQGGPSWLGADDGRGGP